MNFYAASKEELEEEVRKEGSFRIDVIEKFEMMNKDIDSWSYGNAVRSIQEPMIAHHFGQGILDRLFELYGRLVDQELANQDIRSVSIVLLLTKLM